MLRLVLNLLALLLARVRSKGLLIEKRMASLNGFHLVRLHDVMASLSGDKASEVRRKRKLILRLVIKNLHLETINQIKNNKTNIRTERGMDAIELTLNN